MSGSAQYTQELASGDRSDSNPNMNLPENAAMVLAPENSIVSKPISYSQAASQKLLSNQNEIFPSEEQAIVLPSLNDITSDEYIIAISKIISPANILAGQKISFNRMCIFLKSSKLAEDLVAEYPQITIKGHILTIRKLVTPSKRVIISGGSPSIPHIEIEKSLVSLKIPLTSGITFMRAGIKLPELAHIQSFNRQFFANLPDNFRLPESFTTTFNEKTYRMFLNISGACYKCRQEGHQLKDCPQNTLSTQNDNLRNQENTPIITAAPELLEATTASPIPSTSKTAQLILPNQENSSQKIPVTDPLIISVTPPDMIPQFKSPNLETSQLISRNLTSPKRPKTVSSSSQSEIDYSSTTENPTKEPTDSDSKKKHKKKKKAPTPIEDFLEPLETIINNSPSEYALTYNRLKEYIAESKGCKNIKEMTIKYCQNIPLVINTLRKLHPEIDQINLKAQFTKIVNALESLEEVPQSTSPDEK